MEKSKIKNFKIVRVVTKDVITDSFQGIRNFFGLRLRAYEKIINKSVEQMFEEMELQYDIEWYRLIINPLANNSAMIILYGRGVER